MARSLVLAMASIAFFFTGSAAFAAVQEGAADAALVHKIQSLPNPFTPDPNWSLQLPPGLKLGAVIAAQPGPDGNLYVLDRCFENSCIGRSEPPFLVFSPSGKFLRSWGVGLFGFPHGFFFDKAGHIWTVDLGAEDPKADHHHLGNRVFEFDTKGNLLLSLGKAGVAGDPAQGLLTQPTGVVVNDKGEIFVSEGHSETVVNRISKFAKDGKFIKSWGSTGTGPGQMRIVHAIALDADGRVIVADRLNERVEIFSQDGEFITQWKQFGRPTNVYVTPDNTLYVSDNSSSKETDADHPGWRMGIRIGNARDGSVKYFVPVPDTVMQPVGSGSESLAVDPNGDLYATFVALNKIVKYVRK